VAQIPTQILITEAARFAESLLDSAAVVGARQRVARLSGLNLPIVGAIAIGTPQEVTDLLAQPPDAPFVAVLWVADDAPIAAALLVHPLVAGLLSATLSGDAVFTVLKTAQASLAAAHAPHTAQMLERVLEIGRALASEKNLDALLGLILGSARELTNADGASIYTRDPDGELYFRLWQNASNPANAGIEKRRVGPDSLAGYVARSGVGTMVEDAYAIPADAPYRFSPAYDRISGYHTRSMLTLPLTNKADEVLGVLQLINRKDNPEILLRTEADVAAHVRAFTDVDRQVALALAGQAGVALENGQLYAAIEHLFDGFIKASVRAIEARDPTTAGHSFRVAEFTENLAVAVDRADAPALRAIHFSREQLREIRYASLLHDVGKIGVREHVLVKAKKLHPHQLDMLRQRFKYAGVSVVWEAYRGLLDELEQRGLTVEEFRARRREIERRIEGERGKLNEFLAVVLCANEPTVLHADITEGLQKVAAHRFIDADGSTVPLIHEFEFADLSLPKGSLSSAERVQIESHVSHSYEFLKLIPWTRDLSQLPHIAYAHHEKLDGSGYPRRLTSDAIPVQSRMLTIADIYDALTAPDRPYKQAVSTDRALDILQAEARAAKIDATLLGVFIESGSYRIDR